MQETFGLSLAQLLQQFERYARFRATWLPAISSTASVWGFITILFLISTYRKRVASSRTLKEWDDEEMIWETADDTGHDTEFDASMEMEDEDEQEPTLH